ARRGRELLNARDELATVEEIAELRGHAQADRVVVEDERLDREARADAPPLDGLRRPQPGALAPGPEPLGVRDLLRDLDAGAAAAQDYDVLPGLQRGTGRRGGHAEVRGVLHALARMGDGDAYVPGG